MYRFKKAYCHKTLILPIQKELISIRKIRHTHLLFPTHSKATAFTVKPNNIKKMLPGFIFLDKIVKFILQSNSWASFEVIKQHRMNSEGRYISLLSIDLSGSVSKCSIIFSIKLFFSGIKTDVFSKKAIMFQLHSIFRRRKYVEFHFTLSYI